MSGRAVLAAVIAASFLATAPALAESPTGGRSVTATGTGEVRVKPKDRDSNSSIAAAYDAARKAAIGSAMDEAHEYALDYAKAAGLTLGSVLSVSDAQANGFYSPGPGGFFGPFGPDKFCGTTQRLVGKPAPGTRPKFKKVHQCFVPPFAYTTLTVTYSAG